MCLAAEELRYFLVDFDVKLNTVLYVDFELGHCGNDGLELFHCFRVFEDKASGVTLFLNHKAVLLILNRQTRERHLAFAEAHRLLKPVNVESAHDDPPGVVLVELASLLAHIAEVGHKSELVIPLIIGSNFNPVFVDKGLDLLKCIAILRFQNHRDKVVNLAVFTLILPKEFVRV